MLDAATAESPVGRAGSGTDRPGPPAPAAPGGRRPASVPRRTRRQGECAAPAVAGSVFRASRCPDRYRCRSRAAARPAADSRAANRAPTSAVPSSTPSSEEPLAAVATPTWLGGTAVLYHQHQHLPGTAMPVPRPEEVEPDSGRRSPGPSEANPSSAAATRLAPTIGRPCSVRSAGPAERRRWCQGQPGDQGEHTSARRGSGSGLRPAADSWAGSGRCRTWPPREAGRRSRPGRRARRQQRQRQHRVGRAGLDPEKDHHGDDGGEHQPDQQR